MARAIKDYMTLAEIEEYIKNVKANVEDMEQNYIDVCGYTPQEAREAVCQLNEYERNS
tara:strand:+ start:393 stop:566 length:174 start_codon:yes stop_codon:yes gene_type:complete